MVDFTHPRRLQANIEMYVERAAGAVAGRVEIGQWLGVAGRTGQRRAEWRQRLHRHDPGSQVLAKFFA